MRQAERLSAARLWYLCRDYGLTLEQAVFWTYIIKKGPRGAGGFKVVAPRMVEYCQQEVHVGNLSLNKPDDLAFTLLSAKQTYQQRGFLWCFRASGSILIIW